MTRGRSAIVTFNRGRVSKLGLARVDKDRTRLSAEVQTNFMPRTLGSMMLRPGLKYIGTINNSSTAILVPFVRSNDDTALIELTSTAARFWVNDSIVERAGSTAVMTNGTFAGNLTNWTDTDESGSTSEYFGSTTASPDGSSDFMSLIGTRYARAIRRQTVTSSAGTHGVKTVINRGWVTFRVGSSAGGDDYFGEAMLRPGTYSFAVTSTGNFFVEFSANTEYRSLVESIAIESSGDMVLNSTWVSSDLSLLRWDQSADVIFVSAFGYPQKRIERYGTESWGMANYAPETGPFRNPNITTKRLTPSALSGDITLASDQPLFSSDHVGALFRVTSVGQSVAVTPSGTDQWSDPIRVSGVDETRIFDILIGSTFDATMKVQRSVGEVGSWADVSGLSWTSTIATAHDDGLDNQIVFYRIGVGSTFVSGAEATLTYAAGGITGVAKINTVIASTESSARVLSNMGSTAATETWEEGDWSVLRGFPSAVTFHDGRLWWAGKAKIWGSISDAFEDFDPAVAGDSGVINRSIATGPVDTIQWMDSVGRLIIGTDDRELQAQASGLDEPLTPSNFALRDVSSQGSAKIPNVKIDRRILFLQRSGIRVMEAKLSDTGTFEFDTLDRTQVVPEIGQPSITRMAVQRQPDTRVHCVRGATDGTVAVFVTDPAENMTAWVDIESSGGVNGIIEDAAVLPSPGEDSVYYIVKREIDGSTKRYLEKWGQEWDARGDGRRASMSFAVTGGSANAGTNQISSITVDGTEISGPVDFQTDAATTAQAIVTSINNYTLDLTETTYDSVFFDVNAAIAAAFPGDGGADPMSMTLSVDGTLMITVTDADELHSWDLTTPFDTDTAVSQVKKFDFGNSGREIDSDVRDIHLSADGSIITMVGANQNGPGPGEPSFIGGDANAYTVSLGTPFDLNTAAYTERKTLETVEDNPNAIHWNDAGTAFYVWGLGSDNIRYYTGDTSHIANKLGGLTLQNTFAVPNGPEDKANTVYDIGMNEAGTILYVLRQGLLSGTFDSIEAWNLSTAFNTETATVRSGNVLNIATLLSDNFVDPLAIHIDPDKTDKIHVVSNSDGGIYQFSLNAADAVYTAFVSGPDNDEVTILAAAGSGTTPNGLEVVVTVAGDMLVGPTTAPLAGGHLIGGVTGVNNAIGTNKMADSHVVQETTVATTTFSGLDHLVGSSVIAWGHGKDLGSYTVSSTGEITLSEASTAAVAGLPYGGIYKSAKLSETAPDLTQRKNVNHIGLVMADVHAQGIQYGPSTDNLDPMPAIEGGNTVSTDLVHDTFDEASFEFQGSWDTDSRIVLVGAAPRPVTVLGAIIQIDVKEKV